MKNVASIGILLWLTSLAGARADVLLQDSFNYPDGRLADVSTGAWQKHSGDLPLLVSGGSVQVGQNDSSTGKQDVNRLLSQVYNPIADNASKLYAGFDVTFATLPFSSGSYTAGSYFAHFMTQPGGEYYARVGANIEGAAPGHFRLAAANETWSSINSVEYPLDLSVGVTYRVVVRLDLATDRTTLWVNPGDESSSSVTASDTLSYGGGVIDSFALRQGTSDAILVGFGAPGTLRLDNLSVATRFSEALVIPEPAVCGLLVLGFAAGLLRRRTRHDG